MKTLFKYTAIFFMTLTTHSCSSQKIENDLTNNNLKDKVISYSEISYSAENSLGKLKKGQRKRKLRHGRDVQIKYDHYGNLIEKSFYKPDGSLFLKYTKKYDEKGNMIQRSQYNSDGIMFSKETSTYDQNGNKISWIYFNADSSLFFRETYKYDENGNMIQWSLYNSDG
ncbi:MAG TPA: hypothetical protein VJ917_08935, partial [Saprospiraceae bacterium]|nr:hypothetical protein [Saprospiraceae bacterium]